ARVAAFRHRRAARMVLHAGEDDLVLPDGDDAGHDARHLAGALQHRSLLDMRLEETAIAVAVEREARLTGEAGPLQRLRQRGPGMGVGEGGAPRSLKKADRRA